MISNKIFAGMFFFASGVLVGQMIQKGFSTIDYLFVLFSMAIGIDFLLSI